MLKTDGSGNVTWQSDNSASFETAVGPTGSGADDITDGNSDNVLIQAAITEVTNSGGGVIKIFAGNYDIHSTITVPKDPKIKIEGEYITKSGYGGTVLKVYSGLGANLEAIIKEAGNAVANTSNADHSHASQYSMLVFDGSNKSDAGLLLLNTDHTMVNDSKFVNSIIGIDGQFNGDVALADYA